MMQRISNLLILKENHVLLLKKPRRGWYVAPGGNPIDPHLKGTYTMVIKNEETDTVIDEWMLFTFIARDLEGEPFEETVEGILEWHPVESLKTLPMAEGDRTTLLFAVSRQGMQYGTFTDTEEFTLLKETIQQSKEG